MKVSEANLRENIMDDFYSAHPQGTELLDIDIQTLKDESCEKLQIVIGGLMARVSYLEMMENDLRGENAVLRTKIIGNDNKTDESN